jgi:hypothetical protein
MILESVGGVDEDFHGLSENSRVNSLDVERSTYNVTMTL